jgi:hypothetical protein
MRMILEYGADFPRQHDVDVGCPYLLSWRGIDEGRSERPNSTKTLAYDFLGRPKPKIFSKNGPEISIRNHQNEKRRDCTACLQKSLIINGEVLSGL